MTCMFSLSVVHTIIYSFNNLNLKINNFIADEHLKHSF